LLDVPRELDIKELESVSPGTNGDGVKNIRDNCKLVVNADQADTDGQDGD
jgi:hypothetical protein